MVFLAMKRILFSILVAIAAVSCVGQLDDDEPDVGGGSTEVSEGAGIILDFTATWCVNCPRMHEAIEQAQAARPGKVIPISVHFQDQMMCDDGKELIDRFEVAAYPTVIANMDAKSLTTATSAELLLARLDAAASSKKPCAVEGQLQADGTLTVSVTAQEAAGYTLSVALLEDGIVAAQTGATENYVHNNVFRGFLQERLWGDSLGFLDAGVPVTRTYTVPDYGTKQYRVVAFVCHDGIVNAAWASGQN